jgi:hypothetical protein
MEVDIDAGRDEDVEMRDRDDGHVVVAVVAPASAS